MLDTVRRLDLPKAGYTISLAGLASVLLHVLVVAKVIPHTWVNGGRTESYADAKVISTNSIAITVFYVLLSLLASDVIPVKKNPFVQACLSVFFIVTLPFVFLSVVQQFLGTRFEKLTTSLVTIAAFVAHLRIAVEKRK